MGEFYNPDGYFLYNLKSDELTEFPDKVTCEAFAAKNGLPLAKDFNTFGLYYSAYWHGWRLFLLS